MAAQANPPSGLGTMAKAVRLDWSFNPASKEYCLAWYDRQRESSFCADRIQDVRDQVAGYSKASRQSSTHRADNLALSTRMTALVRQNPRHGPYHLHILDGKARAAHARTEGVRWEGASLRMAPSDLGRPALSPEVQNGLTKAWDGSGRNPSPDGGSAPSAQVRNQADTPQNQKADSQRDLKNQGAVGPHPEDRAASPTAPETTSKAPNPEAPKVNPLNDHIGLTLEGLSHVHGPSDFADAIDAQFAKASAGVDYELKEISSWANRPSSIPEEEVVKLGVKTMAPLWGAELKLGWWFLSNYADDLRIGNGAASGGWGWAEDGLRALDIITLGGSKVARIFNPGEIVKRGVKAYLKKLALKVSGSNLKNNCGWHAFAKALILAGHDLSSTVAKVGKKLGKIRPKDMVRTEWDLTVAEFKAKFKDVHPNYAKMFTIIDEFVEKGMNNKYGSIISLSPDRVKAWNEIQEIFKAGKDQVLAFASQFINPADAIPKWEGHAVTAIHDAEAFGSTAIFDRNVVRRTIDFDEFLNMYMGQHGTMSMSPRAILIQPAPWLRILAPGVNALTVGSIFGAHASLANQSRR